jgi:hypothetical protein
MKAKVLARNGFNQSSLNQRFWLMQAAQGVPFVRSRFEISARNLFALRLNLCQTL